MIKFRSNLVAKSALEGPPFLIVLNEKSKSKLRKMYLSIPLLWILHAVFRYSVKDPVQFSSHIIFILLYLPAITILLENKLIITGDHDQWKLLRVKNLFNKHLIISEINCRQFKVEIRIVSSKRYSTALVMLNNPIQNLSIKSPNVQTKDFIDECKIINLEVVIRKRGLLSPIN
ncbi:MAG: hypothetical protein GPJ54_15730 [Candidatus Heimdallarchaeota archaeon]|nr:hypothetical protein [Candidatus Heimdallarchaeota archaeon]